MGDVTVIVGTFGDAQWLRLARERAIPSARAQTDRVIHCHAETLHDALNEALALVTTEWVIHLDADDELEPWYIHAMLAGSGDVRAPSVRYVRDGRANRPPGVPQVWGHEHACTGECLPDGNWIIVGALARTELVRDAGGWRDFDWSEDWDLWLRLWLRGATITTEPDAVYRAHVRADSRNRGPSRATKNAAHQAIYRANFPQAA